VVTTREQALDAARWVLESAHQIQTAVARGADGAEILSACENLRTWLVDVESYAAIPRDA